MVVSQTVEEIYDIEIVNIWGLKIHNPAERGLCRVIIIGLARCFHGLLECLPRLLSSFNGFSAGFYGLVSQLHSKVVFLFWR